MDRYPVADRAVRDLLVRYLAEQAAVLDYGSLVNQSQMLVDLLWIDLERHHPRDLLPASARRERNRG